MLSNSANYFFKANTSAGSNEGECYVVNRLSPNPKPHFSFNSNYRILTLTFYIFLQFWLIKSFRYFSSTSNKAKNRNWRSKILYKNPWLLLLLLSISWHAQLHYNELESMRHDVKFDTLIFSILSLRGILISS